MRKSTKEALSLGGGIIAIVFGMIGAGLAITHFLPEEEQLPEVDLAHDCPEIGMYQDEGGGWVLTSELRAWLRELDEDQKQVVATAMGITMTGQTLYLKVNNQEPEDKPVIPTTLETIDRDTADLFLPVGEYDDEDCAEVMQATRDFALIMRGYKVDYEEPTLLERLGNLPEEDAVPIRAEYEATVEGFRAAGGGGGGSGR